MVETSQEEWFSISLEAQGGGKKEEGTFRPCQRKKARAVIGIGRKRGGCAV